MAKEKNAEVKPAHTSLRSQVTKLRVYLFVTIVVFLLSMVSLVYFVKVNFYKGPSNTHNLVKIQDANSNLVTVRSNSQGYEVTYDKTFWNGKNAMDETKNSSNYSLSPILNGGTYSDVSVFFSNETYDKEKKDIGKDDLQIAYELYTVFFKNVHTNDGKLVDTKKVSINGTSFYRFEYEKTTKSTLLNVDLYNKLIQFVTVQNDKYYVFSIRTSTPNNDQNIKRAEAVIAKVRFFKPGAEVKGASTEAKTLEDSEIAAISKPSVVRIFNRYCVAIKTVSSPQLFSLSGKSYPYCLASSGSGYFVNSNGYIGTNGHVAKMYPDESILYALRSGALNPLIRDFVVAQAQQNGQEPDANSVDEAVSKISQDSSSLYSLTQLVLKFVDKGAFSFGDEQTQLFVQLGKDPFKVNRDDLSVQTTSNVLKADLVGVDYGDPMKEQDGFSSSDVALLKVEGSNYPALPLGSVDNLKSGSKLIVIGYPGVADSPSVVDTSSSEQTVTRGIVSAIKKAAGNKKTLVQTDTSITHGNSGGPGIDDEGNVVGLATYGVSDPDGGGNFNFLRDIQDLKDLMSTKGVTNDTGEVYKTWKKAIEEFWGKEYRNSLADFNKVGKLYPVHPDVQSYYNEAKNKISHGEDKSGIGGLGDLLSPSNLMLAGSGIFSIVTLGALVFLFQKMKKQQSELYLLESRSPQQPVITQTPPKPLS